MGALLVPVRPDITPWPMVKPTLKPLSLSRCGCFKAADALKLRTLHTPARPLRQKIARIL